MQRRERRNLRGQRKVEIQIQGVVCPRVRVVLLGENRKRICARRKRDVDSVLCRRRSVDDRAVQIVAAHQEDARLPSVIGGLETMRAYALNFTGLIGGYDL